MRTAEQIAPDVEVLVADVSSSGSGAPPCVDAADWLAGGEPPGDVTVWGGESAVASERKERGAVRLLMVRVPEGMRRSVSLPHTCRRMKTTCQAPQQRSFFAFLLTLSRRFFKKRFVQQHGGLQETKRLVSLLNPCKKGSAGYQKGPSASLWKTPIPSVKAKFP
jgi:hypothetical protein